MMRMVILAAAVCLISHTAGAHAFLDRASPPVGAEVGVPPRSVSLTYTEPVEPLFSSVRVTDASGVRVDQGAPVARDGGRVLTVALKASLSPGLYSVEWQVTSVDTHKTQGRFTFTVKP
jgi:copper resistance protein C